VSVARAAPSFGPTARAWLPLGEVVRWGELGHTAEQLLVRARDFGDVDAVPSRRVGVAGQRQSVGTRLGQVVPEGEARRPCLHHRANSSTADSGG
jgi:hypothetical protein